MKKSGKQKVKPPLPANAPHGAGLEKSKKKRLLPRARKPLSNQAVKGAGYGGNVPPPEFRWKKGQSGNPKGRTHGAATVRNWLSIMANWRLDRVKSVLTARHVRTAKVIAARLLVDAASQDRTKVGTPIAGPEFDRFMDRTMGKPTQSVELTGKDGNPLAIEANGNKVDLTKLSTDELTVMEAILTKAMDTEIKARALPLPPANGNGENGAHNP